MNVFDLAAKLTLDKKDYEKGLNDAGSKMSTLGSKLGAIGGKIASGIGTAMKVGAAAVGAASTAVGALVTKSVEAYGEYEQLVGGVQKLYGNMGMSLDEYAKAQGKSVDEVKDQWGKLEEAQNLVLKNAQNAFKTAGMSANQYMETATSFSATLINDLGGDSVKAAEATDVAMRAISDNWNTFGGDLGMIQNAYNGFAKQNYAMLDNLKLGYGGTKDEMQRLISDANEFAKSIGQAGDLSMDSFADIITAIDLIQQKQNIAGTTAREASTTIQGSLGMVKAAWENLMVGMADGEADLDGLMGNLVDSLAGYTDEAGEHVNGLIDNILPVVEQALESVSSLIDRIGPVIAEQVPALVEKVFPQLLSAGAGIVSSLANGIIEALPSLLWTASDMLETLMQGLVNATSGQQSKLMEVVNWIAGSFAENDSSYFFDAGFQILTNLISGITNGLPEFLGYASSIVMDLADAIIENAPSMIESAVQLIVTLAQGLTEAAPELIPKMTEVVITIVQALVENAPLLIECAVQLILALQQGFIQAMPVLIQMMPQLVASLVQALGAALPQMALLFVQTWKNIFGIFADYGGQIVSLVGEKMSQLLSTFIQWASKLPERAAYFAGAMVAKFINFLAQLPSKVTKVFNDVLNAVKNFGTKLVTEGPKMAKEFAEKLVSGFNNMKDKMAEIGGNIVAGLKDGISKAWTALTDWVKELAGKLVQGFKDNLKIKSPSRVFADEIGRQIPAGIAMGIEDGSDVLYKSIDDLTSGIATVDNPIKTSLDGLSGVLGQASQNQNITVQVVLEGDADRLFRVMQSKANNNYRLTGNAGMVTV